MDEEGCHADNEAVADVEAETDAGVADVDRKEFCDERGKGCKRDAEREDHECLDGDCPVEGGCGEGEVEGDGKKRGSDGALLEECDFLMGLDQAADERK